MTPVAASSTTSRRRRSTYLVDGNGAAVSSSIGAAGLTGGGSSNAKLALVDWVADRARRVAAMDVLGREGRKLPEEEEAAAAAAAEPSKVGFLELFRFATRREASMMVVGLVAAAFAGLAMPVWLYLLAQSLKTFNDIGKIINAGGDVSILQKQMDKLIYSFAIVGAVSLFSGTVYVAVFTYTGTYDTGTAVFGLFERFLTRTRSIEYQLEVGRAAPQTQMNVIVSFFCCFPRRNNDTQWHVI